jgi:hypothetical protein
MFQEVSLILEYNDKEEEDEHTKQVTQYLKIEDEVVVIMH